MGAGSGRCMPGALAGGVLIALAALAAPALAAPAVAVPPEPVLTAPADQSTVTTALPRISGTGEPADTVVIDEKGNAVCVAVVPASGRWSCVPSTPMQNGAHFLIATQTDRNGTQSRQRTLRITVRAPGPPHSAPPPSTAAATSGGGSDTVPLAVAAAGALALIVAAGAYLRMRRS